MQQQNYHKNEITALIGNFLSKYDETATTGLERLCILLEKELSSSSSSSPSLAREFVKNEQILATFIKVQNRPKVDPALFWKAAILLILGHNNANSAFETTKERCRCIRLLTSDLTIGGSSSNKKKSNKDGNKKSSKNNNNDDDEDQDDDDDDAAATEVVKNNIFSNLKKVLTTFDPENQDNKTTKKNLIPVHHAERALQLCIVILQYCPFLLSSKLAVHHSHHHGSANKSASTSSSSSFVLPFEQFPLFSSTWFPNWCSSLRELRAQYFLAALQRNNSSIGANNNNNDAGENNNNNTSSTGGSFIAKCCVLQNKLLTTALSDPVGLANSNAFIASSSSNNSENNSNDKNETVLLNQIILNNSRGNSNRSIKRYKNSGADLLHSLLESFLSSFVNSGISAKNSKQQNNTNNNGDGNNNNNMTTFSSSLQIESSGNQENNNNQNASKNSNNLSISTGQKCEILRTQQTLLRLIAQCLTVSVATAENQADADDANPTSSSSSSSSIQQLAEIVLRSMIDQISEPNSNYLLSSEFASGAQQQQQQQNASSNNNNNTSLPASNNNNPAMMRSQSIDSTSEQNNNNNNNNNTSSIIASLQNTANSLFALSSASRGKMPNYWMLVLLRQLNPEKRAVDANLSCYILSKHPELFRPYIVRVSSHLTQSLSNSNNNNNASDSASFSSSSSTTAIRVAICNALSRILCSPLPFHLTSSSVANLILSGGNNTNNSSNNYYQSSEDQNQNNNNNKATFFYDLTPQAVVDEICPSWMAEFCHKVIQMRSGTNNNNNNNNNNNSTTTLEFFFILQVIRAALQRATAVRCALQRIFDHRETQKASRNYSAMTNDEQDADDDEASSSSQQHALPHMQGFSAKRILQEASEWSAESQFLATFDHLLSSRLPKIETITSRLQNEIIPQLSSSSSNEKMQLIAQRSFDVLRAYLPAFDRPISIASCLPNFSSSSSTSSSAANQNNQQLLFTSYQISLVSAIASVIKTSFSYRVEHLSRLHHVDNNNTNNNSSLSLIGELFNWAILADRFSGQQQQSQNTNNNNQEIIAAIKNSIEEIRSVFVLVVKSVIVDVVANNNNSNNNNDSSALTSQQQQRLLLASEHQDQQLSNEASIWISGKIFGKNGKKNKSEGKKKQNKSSTKGRGKNEDNDDDDAGAGDEDNSIDNDSINSEEKLLSTSRSFVFSLIQVINTLLAQSKSKNADALSRQLVLESTCGFVGGAALNLIKKRTSAPSTTGETKNNAEKDSLPLELFSNIIKKYLEPSLNSMMAELAHQLLRQDANGSRNHQDDDDLLLAAAYETVSSSTSPSSSNDNQQQQQQHPAALLTYWSDECRRGILARQYQDQQLAQQQQDEGKSETDNEFLTFEELERTKNPFYKFFTSRSAASYSSSPNTSNKALHLLSTLFSSASPSSLPYPSDQILPLLNMMNTNNSGEVGYIGSDALEQLSQIAIKPKAWRKALLNKDIGWLSDPFSVHHVTKILLQKLNADANEDEQQQQTIIQELSSPQNNGDDDDDDRSNTSSIALQQYFLKDSWLSVCMNLLKIWTLPCTLGITNDNNNNNNSESENQNKNKQYLRTAFSDLLTSSTVSLLLVCSQSLHLAVSNLVAKTNKLISKNNHNNKSNSNTKSMISFSSVISQIMDDETSQNIQNNIVNTILPNFYNGSQSVQDRCIFSLGTVLLALTNTSNDASSLIDFFVQHRFCLGSTSSVAHTSRFPELQLLHSVISTGGRKNNSSSNSHHQDDDALLDENIGNNRTSRLNRNEYQLIQEMLGSMSLGLGYDNHVTLSSSSSSSSSIAAQILKNVFPDAASSTSWWDSVMDNKNTQDGSNTTDMVSRLFNAITAATTSSTTKSSSSSTTSFYDPRYLLPLIHSVLAIKQHQLKDSASSKIKISNFYANRVVPFLVRALSSADPTIRDIAFDSLALAYQGLHPTRRIFVDAIVLAMVEATPSATTANATTATLRVPAVVSSALLQSLLHAADPHKSIFESIIALLCDEVRIASLAPSLEQQHSGNNNNVSAESSHEFVVPFHSSLLARVSPDSLITSGAPFFDNVRLRNAARPQNNGKIAKLRRTGLHRELDFVLLVLSTSCRGATVTTTSTSTSSFVSDFSLLYQGGILTHMLSLFHVVCDFGSRSKDLLNCIVSCLVSGGPLKLSASNNDNDENEFNTNNNKTRILFCEHFFQWILSSLEMYSASSVNNGNNNNQQQSDNNSKNNHVSSSAALFTLPLTSAPNAAAICNLLVDAFIATFSKLFLSSSSSGAIKNHNKPLFASLKLVFAQFIHWIAGASSGATSVLSFSRFISVMELLLTLERSATFEGVLLMNNNNNNNNNNNSDLRTLVVALKEAADSETAKMLNEFLSKI